MPLLNRRDWLKAMLAGAAGAYFPFPSAAAALAGQAVGVTPASDGPAPYWLLEPLGPGSDVGHGWQIADLSPVERGAVVLTLVQANAEPRASARVHLCQRGGVARGIAHSGHLDFVLMNGQDGNAPSDERLGLVLLSLARRVERNERLASVELAKVHGLMPHSERVRMFGAESLT